MTLEAYKLLLGLDGSKDFYRPATRDDLVAVMGTEGSGSKLNGTGLATILNDDVYVDLRTRKEVCKNDK